MTDDVLTRSLIDKLNSASQYIGTETPTVDVTFTAFELDLLLRMVFAGAALRELCK